MINIGIELGFHWQMTHVESISDVVKFLWRGGQIRRQRVDVRCQQTCIMGVV